MHIAEVLRILKKEQLNAEGSTMLSEFKANKTPHWKMLISTIMSARAKDEATIPVSAELFKRYGSLGRLAKARQKDVETVIRRIGFYRNKSRMIISAARKVINDFNGKVPDNFEELLEIPGVGRKVAGCIMVYCHKKDAIPVDTHVHRISNRLGWVKTKTPEQTEQELMKNVPRKYWQYVNDLLVWHGKNVCVPVSPRCSKCKVYGYCRRVGVAVSR